MYDTERYSVIRDAGCYSVIDKQDKNLRVFNSRSKVKTHAMARKLNEKFRAQKGRV